jgi:hypothetical protein
MSDPTHVSAMLRLFRDGVANYRPAIDGLEPETGDPQVSLDNLERLIATGLGIVDFLVRPTGVLALFLTGEQYFAPGLRVGTHGLATTALAHIASKSGFGPKEHLRELYEDLPANYRGQLVTLNTRVLVRPMP